MKTLNDYCYIGGGDIGLFPIVGETLMDPYLLERIKIARRLKEIQQSDDFRKITEFINEFDYQDYYDHWDGRVKQDDLLPNMKIRKLKIKKEPCRVLYWRAHVLNNGDVTACGCRDMDGEMIVGNITNEPLYSIWHSDKIKKISEENIKQFHESKFHKRSKKTAL